MSLEGIVSKRADAPYTPGNRGLSLKVECLHREQFVVVGWTGSRRMAALSRRVAAPPNTIPTDGRSIPAVSAPASTPPSSSGCGENCSR
jgi:hypothetical protein